MLLSQMILMVSLLITGGGVDYVSGPYMVTFFAGVTSTSFNITINDDTISEGNESFTLTIDPTSLPDGVTLFNPSSTIVTIVDDDD